MHKSLSKPYAVLEQETREGLIAFKLLASHVASIAEHGRQALDEAAARSKLEFVNHLLQMDTAV